MTLSERTSVCLYVHLSVRPPQKASEVPQGTSGGLRELQRAAGGLRWPQEASQGIREPMRAQEEAIRRLLEVLAGQGRHERTSKRPWRASEDGRTDGCMEITPCVL